MLFTGSLGLHLIQGGVDFSNATTHPQRRRWRRQRSSRGNANSNNNDDDSSGVADVSVVRVALGMLLFAIAYGVMGRFLGIKIPNYIR